MKFTNFTKNTKCIVFSAVLLFCLSVGSASQAEEMYQDIGKRADTARDELRRAGEEQREQAGSLDRAEEAVRNSRDRADRVEENERRDAEIIRECKSILERIRGRGEERH
mgnify:CR=1 FL=1